MKAKILTYLLANDLYVNLKTDAIVQNIVRFPVTDGKKELVKAALGELVMDGKATRHGVGRSIYWRAK